MVKTVRRWVRVQPRVVFGALEAVPQILAACGWQINTAFVERLNLDSRQRVAAVGRRVTTVCQGEVGVRQQLVVFQSYHNFCLPHARVGPALASARADQGQRLSQGVAAPDTCDGGGIDRSRVVAQRGVALSGAALALATDS